MPANAGFLFSVLRPMNLGDPCRCGALVRWSLRAHRPDPRVLVCTSPGAWLDWSGVHQEQQHASSFRTAAVIAG